MRNSRQGLLLIIAVFVLLPEIGNAEIYSPPCHVRDPALPSKRGEADPSLPFIYLEPHEGCFDISKPLTVTIYAVNRSGTTMAVDWSAILESLTLEPVGPGKARPLSRRPNVESVDVGLTSFARLTIDLKDHFVLEGASAYRVTYARPLSDGRIHVASPVTFVVEDSAEIEAIAKEVGDAPARATVATLLKCNPLFAQGVVLKTYGHEDHLWPSLQMRRTCWQTNVGQSTARWQDGVNQLTGEGGPEGDVRALEVLIERLLHLSDNLRVPLDSYAFYLLTKSVEENFKPQHRERIYLKLAGTRDSWVVGQSIGRLVGYEIIESYQDPLTEGGPTLDILFAIADGPDRELAREAISCLSNYYRKKDPRISRFLRRKMTDPDASLALHAAIVSCYSGDWSGFALLLRCTRSDDPDLRYDAIAQLVDIRFKKHTAKVVPLLVAELAQPLSDKHLETARQSLRTYPSDDVVQALAPLLEHQSEQVRRRARWELDAMQRDPGRHPNKR